MSDVTDGGPIEFVTILDSNFFCRRAWHSKPKDLSVEEVGTSLVWGFLKDLSSLVQRYPDADFMFCWDYGVPHRREMYPGYKRKRHTPSAEPMPETDRILREEFYRQADCLRTEILGDLGFSNVFYEEGYEADDLVAQLVTVNCDSDAVDKVVVSADKDFYQLIGPFCRVHNPITKVDWTLQHFRQSYGIMPSEWAKVKAIAGCSGDEILGVPGVGDSKAIKYLVGEMNPDSATYAKIKAAKGQSRDNYKLVKLPLKGTPELVCREDAHSESKWRSVCKRLGIRSLPYPFRG